MLFDIVLDAVMAQALILDSVRSFVQKRSSLPLSSRFVIVLILLKDLQEEEEEEEEEDTLRRFRWGSLKA